MAVYKQVTTIEEIEGIIEKDLKAAIRQVANELKDILKEYIQTHFYDARGTPRIYDRTYGLRDNIKYRTIRDDNNEVKIQIYFDTNAMKIFSAHEGDNGLVWGTHEGTFGEDEGKDVRKMMPYYIDQGNQSPVYSYEGIHFTEMLERHEQWANDRVRDILREKGYGLIF